MTADPGTLVLALVGGALATVALFVNYDGLSSLWSEVAERDSAEFFLLPAVAVAATLGGIVLLQARPRLGGRAAAGDRAHVDACSSSAC